MPTTESAGLSPSTQTATPADPTPGLIRRARRVADLSQRDLAARLGVSQSRIARWETGRSSPTLADLQRVLALADLQLEMHDSAGTRVEPMRADAARDRAGRRYPAHVDPTGRGWWLAPGLHLAPVGPDELRRSETAEDVCVGYERGMWREVLRGLLGQPIDHPTREQLVSTVRAETRRARTESHG